LAAGLSMAPEGASCEVEEGPIAARWMAGDTGDWA